MAEAKEKISPSSSSSSISVESRCRKSVVHLCLVAAQIVAAGSTILTQVALAVGVDKLVIGFYTTVLAAFILLVVSRTFERNLPDVRFFCADVILRLLLLGFMIFVLQILGLIAIQNTSATFVATLHPISPVFTAIAAVIFGVESLNWRRYDGQAKVIGIAVCAVGAAVLPLYEGPCLVGRTCHSHNGLTPSAPSLNAGGGGSSGILGLSPFQFGALCAILANLCTGVLGSFVAKLLAKCPAPATILSFTFAVAAVITGVAAVFSTAADFHAWCLPQRAIFMVLLNGSFTLTLFPFLLLWSVMKLGPTMVSCYTPMNPILTSLLSLFFLGTSIYLGNVLGAVLLILGLCIVSWAEEEHMKLKGIRNCADLEEALVEEESSEV